MSPQETSTKNGARLLEGGEISSFVLNSIVEYLLVFEGNFSIEEIAYIHANMITENGVNGLVSATEKFVNEDIPEKLGIAMIFAQKAKDGMDGIVARGNGGFLYAYYELLKALKTISPEDISDPLLYRSLSDLQEVILKPVRGEYLNNYGSHQRHGDYGYVVDAWGDRQAEMGMLKVIKAKYPQDKEKNCQILDDAILSCSAPSVARALVEAFGDKEVIEFNDNTHSIMQLMPTAIQVLKGLSEVVNEVRESFNYPNPSAPTSYKDGTSLGRIKQTIQAARAARNKDYDLANFLVQRMLNSNIATARARLKSSNWKSADFDRTRAYRGRVRLLRLIKNTELYLQQMYPDTYQSGMWNIWLKEQGINLPEKVLEQVQYQTNDDDEWWNDIASNDEFWQNIKQELKSKPEIRDNSNRTFVGFDNDNTVSQFPYRQPISMGTLKLAYNKNPEDSLKEKLNEINELAKNSTLEEGISSGSIVGHAKDRIIYLPRKAVSGVRQTIAQLEQSEDIDLEIISGRSGSSTQSVDVINRDQMKKLGLDHIFKNIPVRPSDMKSAVFKILKLQEKIEQGYSEVIMVENDLVTALAISSFFNGKVKVLLRDTIETHPNILRRFNLNIYKLAQQNIHIFDESQEVNMLVHGESSGALASYLQGWEATQHGYDDRYILEILPWSPEPDIQKENQRRKWHNRGIEEKKQSFK